MNLQPENVIEQATAAPVGQAGATSPTKPIITHNVIERPARVLLGWLTAEETQGLQSCGGTRLPTGEDAQRAEQARMAVAVRPAGVSQENVIVEAADELQDHIRRLQQESPAAAMMFKEGWKVVIADLTSVCSLQPSVFIDHAERRTAAVDAGDIKSVAAVSLPITTEASKLPLQFDKTRQAWMLSSANPNLRIMGNWSGELQPRVLGVGFAISMMASFVQVARFQGRFLLRDGYHRTYGLLKRGITRVPAFFREFPNFEELGLPAGLLSQAVYMGDRPPLLPDYLDDSVSAEMPLPASQKLILVSGMELTPLA